MKKPAPSVDRRATQRVALIDCACRAIAAEGLSGIRARALAECVGCSVGAVYNLVDDLDELVLLVGQRTMADLNARLDAVDAGAAGSDARFVAWAQAYAAFATAHRNLWRALFEHRLAPGRTLPDWFASDQMGLFVRLEDGLAVRLPSLGAEDRRFRARTLFSAVHGIVALGLEEKLVAMPAAAVEREIATFVRTYLAGLEAERR